MYVLTAGREIDAMPVPQHSIPWPLTYNWKRMKRRYPHVLLSLAAAAGVQVVSAESTRTKGAEEHVGLLRAGDNKRSNNLRPKAADDMPKDPAPILTSDDNKSAAEHQQIRMEHERQLHESYQESLRPSNTRLLRKKRVLSHNPREVNPYTADYDRTLAGAAPAKESDDPKSWTMAGGAAAVSGATFGIVLLALLLFSRRARASSQFRKCGDCLHR